MSLQSPLDRWLGLTAPQSSRFDVDRRVRVPAADGSVLASTHYAPRGVERGPVVLIRTPYGRDGWLSSLTLPRPLAARGYHVLVQDVRGTFDSPGVFAPGKHESPDGAATVAWLRDQAWCDGRVATAGGSYLATTQWATATKLAQPLSAMSLAIGSTSMMGGWYPGGGFGYDQTLRWATLIATQSRTAGALRFALSSKKLTKAMTSSRLEEADRAAIGAPSPIYREALAHADDPQHWVGALDYTGSRDAVPTPTTMVTGWSDLFLRQTLSDHTALVRAGHTTRLIVGPWSHSSLDILKTQARETVTFFDETLRGTPPRVELPVRVFVQGSEQWRSLPAWPPPARTRSFALTADGRATSTAPPQDAPLVERTVTYRRTDPTPAVGGPTLGPTAGSRDQSAVESRSDVLVHTSDVLDSALTVIGTVVMNLDVITTGVSGLVAVRLCDVDDQEISRNVTEGVHRLHPRTDPAGPVAVELDPTAHTFQPGHRLRVHIAASAHPRVVDPRDTDYTLTVRYTETHPSIELPTVTEYEQS